MLPVLAKPPPGLKVDQDNVADPPPGLQVDEPSPAPAKPTKPAPPATIDPGVDVGFGPGVAPPQISPETGMPIQAAKPATGVKPTIAPPPPGLKVEEEPKPYVMTGVGAMPEEPVQTFKPPVTDYTQAPVGQQLLGAGIAAAIIPSGISQAASLLTGRRGMLPKPAIAEPPPGLKVEPEQKPAEQPLPSAVTALAAPNDPDATGKTTQAPDQSGNLQPAKFQYDDDTREKAIAEQTPDQQNLYLKAAQQLAADPTNPELIDRYIGAMMKYAKSEQPGFWESTGRLVGGAMQLILHSPEMIQNLDKVGVTTGQFGAILAKRAAGQEISMQDDAVLHTMLSYFEEGGGSFTEMAENIRNELAKHPAPSLFGPPAVPTDPNMMSWSDINKLPPDQREAVLRSKIQWHAQRYQNEQARQRGELDPFWTRKFQDLTGHDPNAVAALAAHGINVETGSIPTGGMVYNPGNILFPAGEAILGEGPLTKLLADVGDISADAIKGAGWIQKKTIERMAPTVGRALGKAAGYATAKATVMAPLHAIGIPPWMSGWIPVGKTAGRIGARAGEWLGERPQWLRENWWDPYADLIKTGAQDFRDGTNNLLANGGSLAPALVNIPGGAIKGALIAAPFAAGAETPEEVGSTLAFGGLLGGAHEAPLATRDAMFGSMFFRDPSRYPTGNAPKIDYGTNFGGMPLDHASNAFYVNQDRITQQRINDLRARFPNVEIHFLGDADYQDAVARLQKTINPATNQSFLPAGNQRTRGLNVVTDPGTGRALVLVNGESGSRMFDVGAHEIAHSVYRQMSPQEKLLWKNIGAQSNDINALTQRYTRNTTGGTGYNYADLPTEAQIKAGTRKYLPGLDELTQEKMHEELGAETVAALLRGQPIDSFTRNERLIRLAQMGLGRIANTLGIDVTPEEATTILGFKPSMTHMWMMNKVLRDYLRKNPSNIPGPSAGGGGGPGPTPGPKGRKAAAGGPTGGPAQRPTPPPTGGPPPPPQPTPVPHTNNQPEIGGGSTGATTEEINKAVETLQKLGWKKRDAQAIIGSVTGQTEDELVHNALRTTGKTVGEHTAPLTPEEAKAAQAPVFPEPLAQHRLMPTGELVRRATFGDQQAVQALIERHGVDWLEPAEKEDADAARMYRRKYPDQAAEQDARIKAREAVRVQAKAEGKPEPKVVDGNRINELRQQAEREVSQRVKNRDVAIARRHLQSVMEEHNASLPSGDTRVRAKVDPETGRTTYYGTHFDPSDPVHRWLLSQMDPEERKFMLRAQDAIANQSSMNFNYTHAARIEPGEELPTGPEREEEYEAQTAKERAAGKVKGQVGNRTALPISVGVGADGQGLLYTMATDKVITNAIKSIQAMRVAKMTPPYTPDRMGMLDMQDDMRKVSQNHAAGYSGDGAKALVGTRDRPIVRDANYEPKQVDEDRAQFINMVMNARDPIEGPRVTKAGRTTAAGKAVEFAEANQGYTSPIVSRGQERVEVNPLRKELERRGAFKGRELEHGYEQFRGDLMRERDEAAPALRKHGIEATEFTAAPERRLAAAGFMPEVPEEEKIRAPAVRVKGNIYPGQWHDDALNRAAAAGEKIGAAKKGFVLSSGKFLPDDSDELWGIAERAGQLHGEYESMRGYGPMTTDDLKWETLRPPITRQIPRAERRSAAAGFMPEIREGEEAERARRFAGYGYVSPNVEEATKLEAARQQLNSPEHVAARDFFQRVEDVSHSGGRVTPSIGNWEGTAEGSSVTHDPNSTLDELRTKTAVKGLHSGQKGTAVFAMHDDGPDFHYDIDFPNLSHEDVDKLIAKHGFQASTVFQGPEGHLRAHLIDPGGENYEHAQQLATEAGSRSPRDRRGTAAFDGADDRGTAASAYREILASSGVRTRQGPAGRVPVRGYEAGGEHPLQRFYEEAEDNFARLSREHGGWGEAAPAVAPREQPPAQFEAASHNMRPLGYRAAVRLTNGELFSGSDHERALNNATENGSIRVSDNTTQFGFVDKKNNFVSMEDADRLLEKNWYEQRSLPPPEEFEPQIPGSKVGFMPEMPEAEVGKRPKRQKAVPIVKTPDDYYRRQLTPEQQAWLADAQQKAIAGIDQFPELPISGKSYANGTVDFPRAFPGERLTKRQVAEFFDARNERLDFANPEHQRIMAAALTHDVLSRLISDPESLGWYNRIIDAAMQEIGQLNPKILEDPVHNLIMRLAMAVTSQNQKVHPNFESAYRAYLHWDRTGKMPIDPAYFGGGTKVDAMIANFNKINDLIRDHKYAGTEEILKTPMTVAQIKDLFKIKVTGELATYKSEASMLLGPKIGSFFNNLSKLYHTLTADLWFSRTMNRMAGRMLGFSKFALAGLEEPEGEGEEEEEPLAVGKERETQLSRLRDLINSGQLENSNAKQRKTMLKEIRAIEAFKSDPEALDRDTAMRLMPTILDWAKKQHDIYAHSTGYDEHGKFLTTYGDKSSESNFAGKNIDLNFKELQDNPRNGTERENFREIMRQVQANLASLGINIEHADSQAVLWYLEQDIFARAKGRKAGDFSADYLDAAYALRQKYAGKTPDEFGKVPAPEPPPAAPKVRKAKVGAMPEGPEASRPRERAPPWMYPPLSPTGYPQQPQRQELPAAVTELASSAEPEVRRGMMLPPLSYQQPAAPSPSQQPQLLQQPPSVETGDQTGVADFFRKRGDQPITSEHDPRLTTISIGGQNWHVNQEAAPYFQGFLNELASQGAPIRSDGGWVYRQKVGAAGISEHAFGGAIDVNQEGRDEVTPAFQSWIATHPGALAAAENKWHIYGGERFGDLGHFEWGGVPRSGYAAGGPDQETRRRTGSASAAHIMREEGPSDVQDGIPEIFGFRQGQDSEYEALARARAAGDEREIQRIAATGFVQRAIEAGSQQFNDPAIKAQIMSLAHMRGPGGARNILNAVATGKIDNRGGVAQLDPNAIQQINAMPKAEVLRRIRIAREVYDKAVFGQEFWGKYGNGLQNRYAREREFYGQLS